MLIIGPLIGAGVGLLGNLLGGGNKQQQQTQQQATLDPNTQRFRDQFLRPLAQQGAQTALGGGPLFGGPSQTFTGAVEGLQGLGGQLGDLISGIDTGARDIGFGFRPGQFDPNSAQGFFDPFQEAVVQGVQSDFDRQRALAGNQVDAAATRAGIFGGSRAGVADALTQGEIGRNEANVLGNIRSQGFQNAMQQALSSFQNQQGLGLQSAFGQQGGQIAGQQLGNQALSQALGGIGQLGGMFGQLAGLGDLERQIGNQQAQEDIFRHGTALGFANQGFGPVPIGQQGTTTTSQQQNPLNAIAGGALLGSQLFGGGGNTTPNPFPNLSV